MKEIIVKMNKMYTVSDDTVTEFEAGKVCFKTKDGYKVAPSYSGRGGGVFHCTFKKVNMIKNTNSN